MLVLAVDVRLGRLGFVVFEGLERILDWGTREPEGDLSLQLVALSKVRSLIRFHRPEVLVLRRLAHSSTSASRKRVATLRLVRAECKRNSIKFVAIDAAGVYRHFATRGVATKYEIAGYVARKFEELSGRLPRRKKLYESETRAMMIFDAGAAGLTFLENSKHYLAHLRK